MSDEPTAIGRGAEPLTFDEFAARPATERSGLIRLIGFTVTDITSAAQLDVVERAVYEGFSPRARKPHHTASLWPMTTAWSTPLTDRSAGSRPWNGLERRRVFVIDPPAPLLKEAQQRRRLESTDIPGAVALLVVAEAKVANSATASGLRTVLYYEIQGRIFKMLGTHELRSGAVEVVAGAVDGAATALDVGGIDLEQVTGTPMPAAEFLDLSKNEQRLLMQRPGFTVTGINSRDEMAVVEEAIRHSFLKQDVSKKVTTVSAVALWEESSRREHHGRQEKSVRVLPSEEVPVSLDNKASTWARGAKRTSYLVTTDLYVSGKGHHGTLVRGFTYSDGPRRMVWPKTASDELVARALVTEPAAVAAAVKAANLARPLSGGLPTLGRRN